ncbi:SCO family protein [Roseovarius nanhaiticus]|uniref:Protein SCO1/2 n=1 Tax=Roseovarius nanhaiticus TaxID=573024 RepID=A0A1N7EHV1_9RHOB|nr:SCO family protein [Roseovarius nanhaiticus]SEK74145.1 protein SCO1/2 [Roseovarius nanhaiticus]SIR87743.1 protein SCO1/2 [Roseovarius nanhaiticus]
MTRIFAIAAGLALVAVLGGIYLITAGRGGDDAFAQCRSTAVADGGADIGGDFTLVDETGKTVTSAEVIDQPSLIYFGYTFCPDVCPLDVARNAVATEILEERGIMVKPIFISVDPARDTPEVVDDFTHAMHPRMLGLTGSPEQIQAASRAYRTFYKAHEPAEGEEDYYLVDHSTFTYLTLPDEGFVEFFRRETSGEEMADKVQCFVEASS